MLDEGSIYYTSSQSAFRLLSPRIDLSLSLTMTMDYAPFFVLKLCIN